MPASGFEPVKGERARDCNVHGNGGAGMISNCCRALVLKGATGQRQASEVERCRINLHYGRTGRR